MAKKIMTPVMSFLILILSGYMPFLYAAETAPWGSAEILDIEYQPSKVLYDLTSGHEEDIVSVLDRIGYLNKLYGSDTFDGSIIVIVHGGAIPYFAIDKLQENQALMARAQSLTIGTSIEFRMCRVAAKLMKYAPEDIHGFVKMVPMADAEITRLQNIGYAYMN